MIPEVIFIALAFYREPHRYPYLQQTGRPLPADMTALLAAPTSLFSESNIQASASELNASLNECRALVPFFIKRVLIDTPGDYYRMLGLSSAADSRQIKQHYHYIIRLFHPDRDADEGSWDEVYALKVNEAYNTLRKPARRAEYDLGLPTAEHTQTAPAGAQAARASRRRRAPGSHSDERASISPRYKSMLLGALVLATTSFAVLFLRGSDQPGLRIEVGELNEPGKNQIDDSESGDARPPEQRVVDPARRGMQAVATQPAVDTKPTVVTAPAVQSGVADTESPVLVRSVATPSIEETIRQRVAAATAAVSPAVPKPAPEPAPKPRTVQKKPTRTQAVVAAKKKPAIAPPAAPVQVLAEASPERVTDTKIQAGATSVVAAKGVSAEDDLSVAPLEEVGRKQDTASRQPSLISNEQTLMLLAVMMSSYEKGDLERFMSLFAEDASTGYANGKARIYAQYKAQFARPEQRKIAISKLRWTDMNPQERMGSGSISVVFTPNDKNRSVTNRQSPFTLGVQMTPSGLKIKSLVYRE